MATNRDFLVSLKLRNQTKQAVSEVSNDLKTLATALKNTQTQLLKVQSTIKSTGEATQALAKGMGDITAAVGGVAQASRSISSTANALARLGNSVKGGAFDSLYSAVTKFTSSLSNSGAQVNAYGENLSRITTALGLVSKAAREADLDIGKLNGAFGATASRSTSATTAALRQFNSLVTQAQTQQKSNIGVSQQQLTSLQNTVNTLLRTGQNRNNNAPRSPITGQTSSELNASARLASAQAKLTYGVDSKKASNQAGVLSADYIAKITNNMKGLDAAIQQTVLDANNLAKVSLYKTAIGPKIPTDIKRASRDQSKAEQEIRDADLAAQTKADREIVQQARQKARQLKAEQAETKRALDQYYAALRQNEQGDLKATDTYYRALDENRKRDLRYVKQYYAALSEENRRSAAAARLAAQDTFIKYNKPIGPTIPSDIKKAARDQSKAELDLAKAAAAEKKALDAAAEAQIAAHNKAMERERRADLKALKQYYDAVKANDALDRANASAAIRTNAAAASQDKKFRDAYFASLKENSRRDAKYVSDYNAALKENVSRDLADARNKALLLKPPIIPRPKTDEFTAELQRLTGQVSSFRSAILSLGAVLGTALTVRGVFQLADDFKNLQSQLRIVTRDQDNLNDVYARLKVIANDTRQGLEPTVETYSRLARATQTLRVSQDDVLQVTNNITKAVAIFGGPAKSAEAALYQLSQAFASNRLSGDELRSVLEQAPRLAIAIADGLGVPIGKLRELGESGQLTAQKVFKALQSQTARLNEEFGKVKITVSQAITVFRNNLLDFIGTIDETTDGSNQLGKAILDVANVFKDPGFIRGATLAFQGLVDALKFAIEGLATLAKNFNIVAAAFAALGAYFSGKIFASLAATIITAAGALTEFRATVAAVGLATAATSGAVTGLGRALSLLGGPVGIALGLAAGAMTLLFTKTSETTKQADNLKLTMAEVRDAFVSAQRDASKLSEAFRTLKIDQLEQQAEGFRKSIESAAKTLSEEILSKANNPALKLNLDYSAIVPGLQAFQERIKQGKFSLQEFQQYLKDFQNNQTASPALTKMVESLKSVVSDGKNAEDQVKKIEATIRVLKGSTEQADLAMAGLLDTTKQFNQLSFATLIQQLDDAIDKIREGVPYLKEQDDRFKNNKKSLDGYIESLQKLKEAQSAIESGDDLRVLGERKKRIEESKKAADEYNSGEYDAKKKLTDFLNKANESEFTGRYKQIQQINDQYKKLSDELKVKISDQTVLKRSLDALGNARDAQLSNVDNEFNKSQRDRIQGLADEARLTGLVGEARERAAAILEAEKSAREYFSGKTKEDADNIKKVVDTYAKAYDAFKKLQQENQNFSQGVKSAFSKYLEDTGKVADETEKLFTGAFSKVEDALTEFITKGKLDWKSFLDSLYADLVRFSVRGALNKLFGSLFGDNKTNGEAGAGGLIGGLISSFTGVKSKSTGGAQDTPSATPDIFTSIINGLGGQVSDAASNAINPLASAAKTTAASFGSLSDSSKGLISYFSEGLKGLGVTNPDAIKGFIGGTIGGESNYNPSAVNPTSGAYGLFQYLGSRKTQLQNLFGGDAANGKSQVDFALKELVTTEKGSLELLKKATGVEGGVKAATAFERYIPKGATQDFIDKEFSRRLSLSNAIPDSAIVKNATNGIGQVPEVLREPLKDLSTSVKEASTATEGFAESLSKGGGEFTDAIKSVTGGLRDSNILDGSGSSGGNSLGSLAGLLKGGKNGDLTSFPELSAPSKETTALIQQKSEEITQGWNNISDYVDGWGKNLDATFLKNNVDLGNSLQSGTTGIGDSLKGIGDGIGSVFNGFISGLGGIVNGVLSGVGSSLNGIISGLVSLAKNIFNALSSSSSSGGGNSILDAVFKAASAIFSAGAGAGSPTGGLYPTTSAAAVKFHLGGLVGRDGQPMLVPAGAFQNAPRFHSGMGLKPDEIAAILQRDELVIPKNEVARLRSAASSRQANAANELRSLTGEQVSAYPPARSLSDSTQIPGMGGPVQVTVQQTIVASDPNTFRQTLGQQASQTRQAMDRALKRHG